MKKADGAEEVRAEPQTVDLRRRTFLGGMLALGGALALGEFANMLQTLAAVDLAVARQAEHFHDAADLFTC